MEFDKAKITLPISALPSLHHSLCFRHGQDHNIIIADKNLSVLSSVTKFLLILMKSYLTPGLPPNATRVTQAELCNFIIISS